MATMFGRFDVQNEISKSETALIYKALDSESNQVVALKTQRLAPLGDRSAAFVEALLAEGEVAQPLAGQNIAQLYGAGEIEGQFCAAMEYIQGNSITTMLARKEGFSIWDLLDIARQVCAALETAAKLGIVHSSLEPDKIVVQWDGLVKVLGYGISSMSLINAEAGNGLGRLMPYCSPEQIRGEAMDQRSNLFTVGAILYEMVAGRRAFDAEDPVALVDQIENEVPPDPVSLNGKVHPGVNALIMKALAKDPDQRYATARELVDDLEKCKETDHKPSPEAKKAAAVRVDAAAKAAAAMKFVTAATSAGGSSATAATGLPKPVTRASAAPLTTAPASAPTPAASASSSSSSLSGTASPDAAGRAYAARAGASAGARPGSSSPAGSTSGSGFAMNASATSSAHLMGDPAVGGADEHSYADSSSSPRYAAGGSAPAAAMSAAAPPQEAEPQTKGPVGDPMMSAPAPGQARVSFSEMDELPPLKEVMIESRPAAEPVELPSPAFEPSLSQRLSSKQKEEKPKIQPRELAQKAMHEVTTVPPRLLLYSILGAIAVILVIAVAMFFHVRSEDDGLTAAPRAVAISSAAPAASESAPAPQTAPVQTPAPPPTEPQPDLKLRQVPKRTAKSRMPALAATPVVVPGEALVDSTPQGVQFELDGKSDPAWITPFNVTGLAPGKHLVSAIKAGYSSEVRSMDVVSGGKVSIVFHLAPVNALVVVTSTPAGADITLDGKPTHRVTPAQFAVEKGTHSVILKKQGFLDETTTAELGPGQNFQYAPVMRALGDSEAIRTVGRFKKLFGSGGESTAGMGSVSIHTRPKGAQVVINQRILDKMSPVDVMMGPGNYVVDITLTGFKPIHKVVNVEKDGKVVIDETLERE